MSKLAILNEQRTKLMTDAHALLSAETVTAESHQSATRMLAELDTVEGQITSLEALEARMNPAAPKFERSARPGNAGQSRLSADPAEQRAQYNLAFRDYFMHGEYKISQETRDLLTTSDATGGAFIPQLFDPVLIEAQKFYGPIATMVEQKVTDKNGAPIKVAKSNDTSNGLYLLGTEGSTSPTETDPTLSSVLLGVDTLSAGLVKVSFQELQDSEFDLATWINKKFAERHARGLEAIVTKGLDSAGTTLPNSSTGGVIGVSTIATTTSALANGIGWDDLTAAFGGLDAAYIGPNTKWVMNTSTRAYLLGLKDGFGRPFFTPDPVSGKAFSQLLGYDVVLSQSMPNMGASATPILFGDLSKSYVLRTDGQPSILRLNERYADTLEVGFYLYQRVGGLTKAAGISPIVNIKQASS